MDHPLLTHLLAGSPPGVLVEAVAADTPAGAVARCRFAPGSDLDACAAWVAAETRAWQQQRTGGDCDVEVRRGVFAPVVEALCRGV
jgi:hypothetical protein